MRIQELLDGIVSKLKSEEAVTKDYNIELHPDNAKEYEHNHPLASILISYTGSAFTRPVGIQQSELFEIEAIIISQRLNTVENMKGINDVIDEVRQVLTSGNFYYSRLYCTSQKFLTEKDGLWYYSLSFSMPVIKMWGE